MKADEESISCTADYATVEGGKISFWLPDSFCAVPHLRGGVSSRAGGISQPPFQSLNLGLHVGDEPDVVRENRRRVAETLGFSPGDMVCAAQVHGSVAAVVGEADKGRGAIQFDDALPGVDALVTNTPGVLLALFFADCLPILLADPVQGAIGVAHAGWRGLTAGVIPHTISAMQTHFDTDPTDVLAAIGPGIGPSCFEVGPEVAAQFAGETHYRSGRTFVHLALAAKRALYKMGISAESISVCDGCTSCEPERWFSHRREAGRTGRIGAFLGLAVPD